MSKKLLKRTVLQYTRIRYASTSLSSLHINPALNFRSYSNNVTSDAELSNLPLERSFTIDDTIKKKRAENETEISVSKLIELSQSGIPGLQELNDFIYNQMPIRISHRIIELQNLPYGLSDMKSIKKLINLYTKSFYMFYNLKKPNDNSLNENEFINVLLTHYNSLQNAVYLIQNGLNECIIINNQQKYLIQSCPFLNSFLNTFHLSRIKTRILTGQYLQLRYQLLNNINNDNICGIIDFNCNVKNILTKAIDDASNLCQQQFGSVPDVNIDGNHNIKFAYIPNQLHYIFFEIIKNSMTATMQTHGIFLFI